MSETKLEIISDIITFVLFLPIAWLMIPNFKPMWYTTCMTIFTIIFALIYSEIVKDLIRSFYEHKDTKDSE